MRTSGGGDDYGRHAGQEGSALAGPAAPGAVLSILNGEISAVEAVRKDGLTGEQVEERREVFLTEAENALLAARLRAYWQTHSCSRGAAVSS